jgi:hypothetical protein
LLKSLIGLEIKAVGKEENKSEQNLNDTESADYFSIKPSSNTESTV